MAVLLPCSTSSIMKAVGATSVTFGATMSAGQTWVLTANTALFYAQGNTPTASNAVPGTGSIFLAAGATALIDGTAGMDIAVIQDAAGGKATLARVAVR